MSGTARVAEILARPLSIAVAFAVVIALAWSPAAPRLPPGVTLDDRATDRITGHVVGPVRRVTAGWRFVVAAEDTEIVTWSPTRAKSGQHVVVTGVLRSPPRARGPADADRRAGSERPTLQATTIETLDGGRARGGMATVWRWADDTREAWARVIDDATGPQRARAALRGIVTGDRGDVPPSLDASWRAVGIYHALSVSGVHLAVVAGARYAVLRRFAAASPWGHRIRPSRWAAPPALAVAVAYTLITGAAVATVRALIVVALVLAAAMLERSVRLVDAIGVAAIVVLVASPAQLFDPAFQLSFTAVLVLAVVQRPPTNGWRGRGVTTVVTSCWILIATAPITAYHFQTVLPGAALGGLVLGPVLELGALPLALVGVELGELGHPLVGAAVWLVARVDDAATVLVDVAPLGRVALTSAPLVAALVAIALWLASRPRRTRADVAGWGAACLCWALGGIGSAPGTLTVTWLDVGQGDGAIVEMPGGSVWLVDAGGRPGAASLASAAAPGQALERALLASGHHAVDVAIISHPHPDHFLGLHALTLPIHELWLAREPEPEREPGHWIVSTSPPNLAPRSPHSFAALRARLGERGTRIVHPALGRRVLADGVEVIVWGPRLDDEPIATADPVRSVNDNSLVVEIRYRERSILFTGDLEREGELLLVEAGVGPIDIVKVPHHGSPTSSSAALVEATRPSDVVISCGVANAFGFPAPDVIQRWGSHGARVSRTDRDGAVTVRIDAAGSVAVERFVVQSAPW